MESERNLNTMAMHDLEVKRTGLAVGITSMLLYAACALLMLIAGPGGTVKFFNSLFHGLDVSTVVRMDIPLWEAGVGIVGTFMLGWLVGACIAAVYNVAPGRARPTV